MDLETGGKVGELVQRLKKARKSTTEAARTLLMSRPETRNLLKGAESLDNTAHDSKSCMTTPEPRCLLVEASISAKDIEKPEMRDWALGEILTAQARAGLAEDAIATTRRIHDPRLIVVALRDIAKAQATTGETEAALAAVDIIPDLAQQVEAYVAIAEIQADQGQIQEASETAKHLETYLSRIKTPLSKITFHTRIAVILFKAGHIEQSASHLTAAEKLVHNIDQEKDRNEGKRYVAGAYAETDNPSRALDVLKSIKSSSEDAPVLIAAATRLAQAGDSNEALITADAIEAVRYRSLVLARIASYQAGAGDLESARTTMDKALAAAITIKFPFAKAYAYSRIALALNEISVSADNDVKLLEEALKTAGMIKDERLKAHILWSITDVRDAANDKSGAATAKQKAETATEDIKIPFSRVWMLCDIAEERAKRGAIDAAWSLFDDALTEAKTISHPWGRARSLGKVASTMTILADQTSVLAARKP
jgi:tetratricopeptide (TPR) repeat protein